METLEIIDIGEIKEEDLVNIACIQIKDKMVWLGKDQEFVLSRSGKTVYIVQHPNSESGLVVGKVGYRVANCVFFAKEYHNF